jgi:dihydrofolate reductase
LIYSVLMSLDGYVADEDGSFDWAVPDDEVHAFVNDLQRSIGTHLYGRRLYEVMRAWETMDAEPGHPPASTTRRDLKAADKVVLRRSRRSTRPDPDEREFDVDAVRAMKTADADCDRRRPRTRGLRAGLVDDAPVLAPAIVGGGTRVA